MLLFVVNTDATKGLIPSKLFSRYIDIQLSRLPQQARLWSEEFLNSVRRLRYDDQQGIAEMFDRLSNLSVGPLRTMRQGVFRSKNDTGPLESISNIIDRLIEADMS